MVIFSAKGTLIKFFEPTISFICYLNTKPVYLLKTKFWVMKKTILTTFIFGFIISNSIFSQDLLINLAENEGDTLTIQADKTGDYLIKMINKVPGESYIVQTEYVRVELPKPFDFSFQETESDSSQKSQDRRILSCSNQNLIRELSEFKSTSNESDIPKALEELKESFNTITFGCIAEESEANALISNTQGEIDTLSVKKNYNTQITILRNTDDGKVKKWVRIIKSPKKGEWRTMYGFTFATNWPTESDKYFSQQSDTVFTISKATNNDIVSYLPTVYFVWESFDKHWLVPGFAGGIGIEEDSPAITAGLIWTIHDNIGLTIGLTAHKQQKLLGQYSEGQIIKESLTEEQLHESVYRFTPSFSLAFRFKESPFGS